MSELQKEMCVNYFASILLGEVPKVPDNFFKQNVSMTLIPRLQWKLWECSRIKINKAKVVRSLYFKVVSLVFWNLAINKWLRALLGRWGVCASIKNVVPKAVKLSVVVLKCETCVAAYPCNNWPFQQNHVIIYGSLELAFLVPHNWFCPGCKSTGGKPIV